MPRNIQTNEVEWPVVRCSRCGLAMPIRVETGQERARYRCAECGTEEERIASASITPVRPGE